MAHIFITRVAIEDIMRVRKLAVRLWPKAFEEILFPAQIAYMMKRMYSQEALLKDVHRGIEYYLLQSNGKDGGYAALEKVDAHTSKLHKIYILQMLQGKGLGKFLISHMETIAKCNGTVSMQLNVNRQNKALKFYENCGYKIIRTEDIDIGEGYYMNDYVMAKSL